MTILRQLPWSLVLCAALLGGCGSGSISDIFHAFPPEVFKPPDPTPPTPPPGGGGGFTAGEVKFLEAAQGVSGDVRNIALAQVGARTLAFLAAGTSGCHVVDVTKPELVNSTSYVTTIRASTLTVPPAALDGGRVDAVAVIDNAYVVCIAVGTAAPNAVSLFHIPSLVAAATTPSADLSAAFVPRTGDIPVPGNASGKAGGVSGAGSTFVIATGGPALGFGVIAAGTPGTWTALPAFVSPAAPAVDRFLDAFLRFPNIYVSVQSGATFGILALNITVTPAPGVTVATPQVIAIPGDFPLVAADSISGPGNFPLDLDVDTSSLFIGGVNEVQILNVTNPVLPAPLNIAQNTGVDTIAVEASGGFFAVGAGDRVRVYSTLTGQPLQTASVTFTGTFTIRGVALHSSSAGRFVLCCAGTRGLRVVQWSNIP